MKFIIWGWYGFWDTRLDTGKEPANPGPYTQPVVPVQWYQYNRWYQYNQYSGTSTTSGTGTYTNTHLYHTRQPLGPAWVSLECQLVDRIFVFLLHFYCRVQTVSRERLSHDNSNSTTIDKAPIECCVLM